MKIPLKISVSPHANEMLDMTTHVIQSPTSMITYKGSLKDSKRHGYGEFTQIMDLFGQRKKVIIKGKWKEGFLHG